MRTSRYIVGISPKIILIINWTGTGINPPAVAADVAFAHCESTVICHLHLSPVCRMICLSLTSRVQRLPPLWPRTTRSCGTPNRKISLPLPPPPPSTACTYWITFPLPENVFDSTTACYFSITRRYHTPLLFSSTPPV